MPKETTPQPYDSATNMTIDQQIEASRAKIRSIETELSALDAVVPVSSRSQEDIRAEIRARELELGILPAEKAIKRNEGKPSSKQEGKKALKSLASKKPKEVVPKEHIPYSTPSPFEKEQIHDTQADFARLSENYAKKGLGEIATKLNALPEFQALTSGQKMLVLQGANDKLLEHVEENALKAFKEEQAESKWYNPKRIWRNANKSYFTAEHRKSMLRDATGAGAEKFIGDIAPELIAVFGDSGLESHLGQDGKTVITDFARLENPSPLARQMAEEYNQAATALSRIPREWGLPSASRSHKKAYENAQFAFVAAKDRFAPELIEHSRQFAEGKKPQVLAATQLERSEDLVEILRYGSQHPDSALRLKQMESRSSFRQAVQDIAAERGTMMVVSGLARNIFRFAGPVASTVIGYYRGKQRAEKSFVEQDRLARRGEKQKGTAVIGMGSAERHIARLSGHTEKLLNASSEVERSMIASQLKTYVDFIEAKLAAEQVNFGDAKGRFMRHYELGKLLHSAQVAIGVHSDEQEIQNAFLNAEGGLQGDARMRQYIRAQGAMNARNVEVARENEVKKQARRSAFYGGLFGSAGAAFSYFSHNYGLFGDVKMHGHTEALSPVDNTRVAHQPYLTPTFRSGEGARVTGLHEFPTQTPPPIVEPKIDVSHAAAQVTFSSKGAEQTILNFRHSPGFKNLAPDQQKFFEGNVAKIARELKGLRVGAADGKESLLVGKGSEFGISADGKVFITDTLHGGHKTILGHLEGSTFKADASEADLHYIHAGAGSHASGEYVAKHAVETAGKAHRVAPSSLVPGRAKAPDYDPSLESASFANVNNPQVAAVMENLRPKATVAPDTDMETLTASATPVTPDSVANPSLSPNMESASFANTDDPQVEAAMDALNGRATSANGLETLTGSATPFEAARDSVTEAVKGYVPGQEFTPELSARISSVADRIVNGEIEKYFSFRRPYPPYALVHGLDKNNLVWASWSHHSMRSILKTPVNTYIPRYRPLFVELKNLAEAYPDISREQTMDSFMKEAYTHMVEDQARAGKLSQ